MRIANAKPSEATDEESEENLQHETGRREDASVVSDAQPVARGWQDQGLNRDQDAERSHALALARG